MRSDVLLIDDDPAVQRLLSDALGRHTALRVSCASSRAEGVTAFTLERPPTVLLDVGLPDGDGLELLDLFLGLQPATSIFVLSGQSAVETIVRAVQRGAIDYFQKPFALERLVSRVQSSQADRREAPQAPGPRGLLGQSQVMQSLVERLRRVGPTASTVVIMGETGVGKELVARALHELSPRARGPFVAVNCSALPATLLEAELFGYERGAFTGATTEGRSGLLEAAHGGTILLDEIADATPAVQMALLRVIEQRAVRRIGGVLETPVDVRVVASTNKDLQAEVAAGRFRADLYFRLRVVEIVVPPLRERREDIALLARHFLEQEAGRLGRRLELSAMAVARLEAHAWPGNVRELHNTIESAAVLARGSLVAAGDFDLLSPRPSTPTAGPPAPAEVPESLRLDDAERRLLARALAMSSGNRRQAAALLGVNRTTIYNMCRRHRIGAEFSSD